MDIFLSRIILAFLSEGIRCWVSNANRVLDRRDELFLAGSIDFHSWSVASKVNQSLKLIPVAAAKQNKTK
jgi:formylmethanofuran dehydrogenase subunit A